MTKGRLRLRLFCNAIKNGKVPDAKILQELATAFDAILKGESADKALELQRPRGRKPHGSREHIEHWLLVELVLQKRESGLTRDKAIEAVSIEQGIPFDTLERYYKKKRYREAAKTWRGTRATIADNMEKANKLLEPMLKSLHVHWPVIGRPKK